MNSVTITLDKERKLILNMRAMIAFEKATGKSWLKGEVDFDGLTLENYCTLIWAMLLTDDPKLTLNQVIDMLDVFSMDNLSVVKAINLATHREASPPLAVSPPNG